MIKFPKYSVHTVSLYETESHVCHRNTDVWMVKTAAFGQHREKIESLAVKKDSRMVSI